MDAVKNITFKVRADDKDAATKIKALNNELSQTAVTTQGKLTPSLTQSNMQLQSMSRIVQDMPFGFMAVGNNITFMAEQMAYAKSQGIGLGAQLKGMAASLAGPGGVILGISALTTILTILQRESGKAKETINQLRQEIEELVKIQQPKGFFNIKPEDIPAALELLKEQRKATYEYGKFWREEGGILGKDVETIDETIKFLEQALETEKSRAMIVEMLTKAGLTYTEETKKQTEEIKKQKQALEEIINLTGARGATANRIRRSGGATPSGRFGGFDVSEVGMPNKPSPFDAQALKEDFALVGDLITSTAGLLRSEFMQAWEDIFGEANSLFEKFIANVVDQLLKLAAMKLATSFLSFIPGVGPLLAAGASAAGGNSPVILKIGEDDVGTFVRKGNEYNRMRRRN